MSMAFSFVKRGCVDIYPSLMLLQCHPWIRGQVGRQWMEQVMSRKIEGGGGLPLTQAQHPRLGSIKPGLKAQ